MEEEKNIGADALSGKTSPTRQISPNRQEKTLSPSSKKGQAEDPNKI
jgi:hypothetical protein